MRSDNPKNNKNVMESLKNNKNVATSDLSESTGSPRWEYRPFIQRPTIGSRWWRGNFTLGLVVDSHPRFKTFILALIFFEVGFTISSENAEVTHD